MRKEGDHVPNPHPVSACDPYPPIGDYGFIADCHSSALVSKDGSIDWCCMPRIDSGSCFGRLLGWETGGFCRLAPADPFTIRRDYIADTLILQTVYQTEKGKVRLTDLFPLREGGRQLPHLQLMRVVEGLEGEVLMKLDIFPCFDYGAILPWVKTYRGTGYMAIGGRDGLLISGDFTLEKDGPHGITAQGMVKSGERLRLSVVYRPPEELDREEIDPPDAAEMDRRLEESISLWQGWSARGTASGNYGDLVRRSALVLKGLSNARTGAMAAAATTSLPEAFGGTRNWDYRFTWIRDSVFATRSLLAIGHWNEADDFRRFIERSAAGSAAELQIMFGVGGERRLTEFEVTTLAGYRGAQPVRIGNAAYQQIQLDMYGELLDLAWRWHLGGHSPDDAYWEFLVEIVGEVSRNWRREDHSIWELRGKRRHFVFSKVMCWSAVDKAIALAKELGREAPLEAWTSLGAEIRREVENKGYDRERGVFVQYFGARHCDAALLRLPMTGFIAFDDPRMLRTVDAIKSELEVAGLLRRYPAGSDGFPEDEGTFLACTFWLAECLARQGRLAEAREVFQRAADCGNDLSLFTEEYDQRSRRALGNFPQALTHMSLISAAVALENLKKSLG